MSKAFLRCPKRLGVYPVVDSSTWVERLATLGVRTIQLRMKNCPTEQLIREVMTAVGVQRQYGLRLFINDYWSLAIAHGAYGVHLGQEDLESADLEAIRRAGLRLGISTHTADELKRAQTRQPSYVALGAVYPTTLKQMPTAPLGIKGLQELLALARYPTVAIGGISLERAPEVLSTGVGSIAMVSAITQAPQLEQAVKAWLALVGVGGD